MYVANAKRLTLAGARKMMATAMGIAEKENIPIAVAIADAGGKQAILFSGIQNPRHDGRDSSIAKPRKCSFRPTFADLTAAG